MNKLIILAACVAAASAWGQWKEGLSVRFGTNPFGIGTEYFIPLPRTTATAKNARWLETPRPAGPLPSLVMLCPSRDDVSICGLFDDNGFIAGLQIALPEDSWTNTIFDMATQGFTRWTAPANSSGVQRSYWTTNQYYVSEEYLKKSKEDRLASRVEGRFLQEQALWLTSFYGELMRVSGIASELTNTARTLFTKQSCIPLMGQHYYYNLTATTPCTAESLLHWFTTVDPDTDQLIATGLVTFGQLPPSSLVKDYFERPPRNEVEFSVPYAPECVYKLTEDVGIILVHIYFVDSPWRINCL